MFFVAEIIVNPVLGLDGKQDQFSWRPLELSLIIILAKYDILLGHILTEPLNRTNFIHDKFFQFLFVNQRTNALYSNSILET